jgi:site-specific recombinase XerD
MKRNATKDETAKNKPAHRVRLGSLSVTVWQSAFGEGKPTYRAHLVKSYRDPEGIWQETTAFRLDDLVLVSDLARRAADCQQYPLGFGHSSDSLETPRKPMVQVSRWRGRLVLPGTWSRFGPLRTPGPLPACSPWRPRTPSLTVTRRGFFYSHTAPRDWPTLQRLRVRREKALPDVLSVAEVRRLIDAVRLPHYQTYFWTVYSLGLRRTEGLHLQVRDIDAARMAVHVHLGKGAKDRYVPLPSRTLAMLRAHWATHRHPVWLFPATGADPRQATAADGPMPRSSVQKALQRVVQGLKFRKAISIHTLRHSYATHLLEAGVNLRLIQQYLGHSSLRTTMVYLHLTSVSHEQAFARIEELMGP